MVPECFARSRLVETQVGVTTLVPAGTAFGTGLAVYLLQVANRA